MVFGRESGHEVYRLGLDALTLLDAGAPADPVLRAFELHLLAASGYAPALDRCRACGRAAEREDPRYLTLERGGLVCRRCVRVDEPVRPVAAATARELARLARSPLAEAAAGTDAAILREAAAVTAQLVAAVTSGPVHSLGLLDEPALIPPRGFARVAAFTDARPTMEKVVNLCKRRGFVYPGSEIYGGLGSSLDYGPLGVELKRNVKEAWWREIVTGRDDVVGLDAAVIMHPRVWEASGHLAGFTDPLVDCKSCKQRFRADQVAGTRCPSAAASSPRRGSSTSCSRPSSGRWRTRARGLPPPGDGAEHVRQLPECARDLALEAALRHRTDRALVPQRDHPGQLPLPHARVRADGARVLRPPGRGRAVVRLLAARALRVVRPPRHRARPPSPAPARPRRARALRQGCVDVEYAFPFGWSELEGIANRTDFDLKRHSEYSGKDLTYFDEERRERYFPYVIEPAAGADRSTLAFLVDAYDEDEVEGEARIVLRSTRASPPTRRRCFPSSEKTASPSAHGASTTRSASTSRSTTIRRARSGGATAARTRSARPSASPSTTTP